MLQMLDFVLKYLSSVSNPDNPTEVIEVNRGYIACVGTSSISGITTLNNSITCL